jgi:hypothetical protein
VKPQHLQKLEQAMCARHIARVACKAAKFWQLCNKRCFRASDRSRPELPRNSGFPSLAAGPKQISEMAQDRPLLLLRHKGERTNH